MHSNVLRKFTAPDQRLVLIPPFYGDRVNSSSALTRQLYCGSSDCDVAMVSWAEQFLRTFLNASWADAARVVAAMPYRWTGISDGSGRRAQGGKELPGARAAWEAVGRAVVAARTAGARGLSFATAAAD
jgi:hypothetical protein